MARRKTRTELMPAEIEALLKPSVALHDEIRKLGYSLRIDSEAYKKLDQVHDALIKFTCQITGNDMPPWDSKRII